MYFGVKKSGISVFLVSAENGAGVNKKTNIMYGLLDFFPGPPPCQRFNLYNVASPPHGLTRNQMSREEG